MPKKKVLENLKRPFKHINKVKNVKWLLPGWAFYEFYKLHKGMGETSKKSFMHGAKAEAIRLAAFASLPVPGTYELTTTGLALLKKKIENEELDKLTLKGFKDFIPVKKTKVSRGIPHLRIYYKDKKVYFEIFYKKK